MIELRWLKKKHTDPQDNALAPREKVLQQRIIDRQLRVNDAGELEVLHEIERWIDIPVVEEE